MVSQEPAWLSEGEIGSWRWFVLASRLISDQLDRQMQRDAGMPHAYWMIMVLLAEAPDRELSMTRLAELTKVTRSRLSHAVTRLVVEGYLARRESVADRRIVYAVLTDSGVALMQAVAPAHVAAVRRALIDHLTAEQFAQFGQLCKLVVTGIQSGDTDATDLPWVR